jgi:hypothetical protein
MGGTRVARAAGTTAERKVTSMPTASETTTVRGARIRPLCGMSMLAAWKSWMTPAAMPRPARIPSTEASSPMTSASMLRVARTCRRVAPSARSMANSRRRCATVMENALKMMKAPTRTAMPPNDSSMGLRNMPMASLSVLVWSAAAWVPVFTVAKSGMAALTRSANVSAGTPATALASISEKRPCRPNQRCRSARVPSTMVEPPSDDCAANVKTPLTRTSSLPPGVTTVSVEPMSSFLSCASFWMIATSPGCVGRPPFT